MANPYNSHIPSERKRTWTCNEITSNTQRHRVHCYPSRVTRSRVDAGRNNDSNAWFRFQRFYTLKWTIYQIESKQCTKKIQRNKRTISIHRLRARLWIWARCFKSSFLPPPLYKRLYLRLFSCLSYRLENSEPVVYWSGYITRTHQPRNMLKPIQRTTLISVIQLYSWNAMTLPRNWALYISILDWFTRNV